MGNTKVSIDSRWWYGNALTAILGAGMMLAALLNVAVGGSAPTAMLSVGLSIATFGVGYLSILTFYVDVRRVRASSVEYNPSAWWYALGWIILSPWIGSVVYLYNRNKYVETF